MEDRDKSLKKIVNASGFVFQLALEHKIRSTSETHGWGVIAREHPWRNIENGSQGYIDIILGLGRMRLVIECKRPKDAAWIFLNPNDKRDKVRRARLLWTKITDRTAGVLISTGAIPKPSKTIYESVAGWHDLAIAEESPESQFCVIRGQGEEDKTMLERISSQLITSIECLANEEIEISNYKPNRGVIVYMPVIVTTAQIELCHFDPGKIALLTGILSEGTFTTVPFIRFRKSLTTRLTSTATPTNIEEANQDKERTVLIMNSDSFCDLLQKLNLDNLDPFSPLPWTI
jgi:hypothetical protein